MPSSTEGYSVTQRFLHWSIALLLFFNLLFPDGMNAWHRIVRHGGTPTAADISAANLHAFVGIAVLLLAVVRLALRILRGVPPHSTSEPRVFRAAARLTHAALYLLIFAMPLSGMASYYFGYGSVGSVHADILKVILWALIGIHVLGALVHQFYWRTTILRRMTLG